MTRVLVIDNEAQTRRFLRAGFELHDYTVLGAENAAMGLRVATTEKPDLIILDPDLPDLAGSEVLERIRSWSNVPIIAVSILKDEDEKVRMLRLGADDYVVKPFGISEVVARAEAVLRRHWRSAAREPIVRVGPLSIDLVSRAVTLNEKRVQLTRKEFSLLHALAAHAGLMVTHPQLIREVWGARADNIQYLRILVRKLRQKVEIDPTRPALIISESGVGYRLGQGSTALPKGKGEIPSNPSIAA
jgi:two-component system, OmpR family, KDP operon response regulator KdpE